MSRFIVEIPVGFNYSAEIEADNWKSAIEATIEKCEDEYPFMNLEYDRKMAWFKELK